jgi:hypothetical protein
MDDQVDQNLSIARLMGFGRISKAALMFKDDDDRKFLFDHIVLPDYKEFGDIDNGLNIANFYSDKVNFLERLNSLPVKVDDPLLLLKRERGQVFDYIFAYLCKESLKLELVFLDCKSRKVSVK